MRRSILLVLILLLLVPALVCADRPGPSAGSLLQGFAAWERSLQRLSGYCLDRACVEPYLLLEQPGTPPPAADRPAPADWTYSAYFFRFGLFDGDLGYALAPLVPGPEPVIGSSPGGAILSFAGATMSVSMGTGAVEGAPPLSTLKPMTLAGPAALRPPLPGVASPELPGIGTLSAYFLSLLPGPVSAEAPPPPEGRIVGEPREDEREDRVDWILDLAAGGADPARWEVHLCPDYGGAPTQITEFIPPAGPPTPDLLAGGVLRRWVYLDYALVTPGVWTPQRLLYYEFLYPAAGAEARESHARTHELTFYRLSAREEEAAPGSVRINLFQASQVPDVGALLRLQFPELAGDERLLQRVTTSAQSADMPPWPEALETSPFPGP